MGVTWILTIVSGFPVPTVRMRNIMNNRLLLGRQFTIDVSHPGRANISKEEVQDKISEMYGTEDKSQVVVFGFHTQFRGKNSTGFGMVYDNLDAVRRYEPNYR